MVQIHFLHLSPQHWPESLAFTLTLKPLLLLCTLSVTSCTSERSFSGLKHIKTVLRSSMSNEHLSSLTLLHMHQDIPIDIEEVIDEFTRSHPRWPQLSDSIDSYLFIVLLHLFLLTLHMHINNESLWSNLVKGRLDSETSTGIQKQHNSTWKKSLGQPFYVSIYKRPCNYSASQG